MKKTISLVKKIFLFLPILMIWSCRSENEEDYIIKNNSSLCDTLYVTYQKQIKPLLDNNCAYCHSNNMVPGCNLDNYENTINYIRTTGTKLYNTVKDNTHEGVVLDSCSLKQLSKWVKNPAP